MNQKNQKILRKTIHWLLALGLVVYIVTGFGITEWQTVEPLTLGLMGKAEAQQIHNAIEIPFVLLLVAHFYLSLIKRKHRNSG
jgi:thiosulfate reductase cytochrome b subunit